MLEGPRDEAPLALPSQEQGRPVSPREDGQQLIHHGFGECVDVRRVVDHFADLDQTVEARAELVGVQTPTQ